MNNAFATLLGSDYLLLPSPVKAFHEVDKAIFEGHAVVKGKKTVLAAFIRWVFNFPVPSESTAVTVSVERTDRMEKWRRNFGGRSFASSFRIDESGRLLSEVFGPFRFYFALTVSENRLNWNFIRWSIGPIPLPTVLGPKIVSWEGENSEGKYQFFSTAHFPIIGELIYYDGFVSRV
ncbi:DUF4166 domain-containing protein [Chitinivorax sp. B]|uniref:DUF4166 domain-containing protein n=1 Tax=Chitinivorax sp. B TaxID=2502235 RepID=UPI0010F5B8C6|nr:DUF4166 domain-containing protein [Chitinivorax sp. B]